MGGGSPKMEVTDYYMSLHFGICLGPIDKLKRVIIKEKEAWTGNLASSAGVASFAINKPDLFGGRKKEGGAVGTVTFLPGAVSQVLPDDLATRLGRSSGADAPGFRGITSLFFTGGNVSSALSAFKNKALNLSSNGRKGFLWASNQPYLPGVWAQVERAPKGLDPTKAMIGADANPAHIIYEALTNTDYGMGAPGSIIDQASFAAAADTLFSEGFGLSMLWTRQSDITAFVSEVLDHIQATLFVHPSTGLLTIKLIRADYDPSALPVLTPDNADLSNFQRKGWGETINEIIVTWTNPENEQEETVSMQDLGAIAAQGDIVSDSRNYYGVRNSELAMKLAARDLASSAAPLISVDAEVDRTLWDVVPGDVVRLSWPEYGISNAVMRVGPTDYGRTTDPTIRLSLVEDIFGRDLAEYDLPPSTEWIDTSQEPTPITTSKIVTIPAFLAGRAVSNFASVAWPEVVAAVLASSANLDCDDYRAESLFADATGADVWAPAFEGTNIGRALLGSALTQEVTSTVASLTGFTGSTNAEVGGFVFIGGSDKSDAQTEIAYIADVEAGTITLSRGAMDTVPRDWPVGTPIWFVSPLDRLVDSTIRSDGETVEYKLRTKTSLGVLDLDLAPIVSSTLSGRPHYPTRPANVTVKGVAFTPGASEVDAVGVETEIPVAWATRNRLTENSVPLAWTAASIPEEVGQTTTVGVYDLAGVLITEHAGLTGTSFALPKTSFGTAPVGIVRVSSERDGFESLQAHELRVRVAFDPTIDFTGDASVGYELLSGDMTDGDDAILQTGS